MNEVILFELGVPRLDGTVYAPTKVNRKAMRDFVDKVNRRGGGILMEFGCPTIDHLHFNKRMERFRTIQSDKVCGVIEKCVMENDSIVASISPTGPYGDKLLAPLSEAKFGMRAIRSMTKSSTPELVEIITWDLLDE